MNSYLVNERRLLIDEAKKNPESGEHNCFSGGYQLQTSKQVMPASGDTASVLMDTTLSLDAESDYGSHFSIEEL